MGYDWSIAEKNLFTPRFGSMTAGEMKKILFAVYKSGEESLAAQYATERALGLTENQYKTLNLGSNLLTETTEKTREDARVRLKNAFEHAGTLVEYLPGSGKLSIQIDDNVALRFLSAELEGKRIYRDVDVRNGHLTIPIKNLDVLLSVVSDYDEKKARKELRKRLPETALPMFLDSHPLFENLAGIVSSASDAASIIKLFAFIL